jgi:hypothetical protein
MSEHQKPGHDETRDEQGAAEPREARLEGIPRRKFLGSILVGTAAGGALLPWSSSSIATASTTTEPFCDPSEVPWDINPFDPNAVVQAATAMASFPFSPAARTNLDSITPIADRWAAGGARALDDKDLATVFELGWLPTAEVNRDSSVRQQVNSALYFRDKVWAPTPDNRDLYASPIPSASRARLQRFEAGVEVQGPAAILIVILIVILVCDFPKDAR